MESVWTHATVQPLKDAVDTNFPGLNNTDRNSLLWGATAFPMGSSYQICEQLVELRRTIDGVRSRPGFVSDRSDLQLALGIADAQVTACMKNEVKSQCRVS